MRRFKMNIGKQDLVSIAPVCARQPAFLSTPISDVHQQAELAKMIEDVTGASDKARSSVEEKSTVVSKERKPELKGCCAALALRLLTHGDTIIQRT